MHYVWVSEFGGWYDWTRWVQGRKGLLPVGNGVALSGTNFLGPDKTLQCSWVVKMEAGVVMVEVGQTLR